MDYQTMDPALSKEKVGAEVGNQSLHVMEKI